MPKQFANIPAKITRDTHRRMAKIAQKNKWYYSETLDNAVSALERELAAKAQPKPTEAQ